MRALSPAASPRAQQINKRGDTEIRQSMPTLKKDTRFQVLTCDCQGTSPLDRKSIEAAAGISLDYCGTQLCRQQIDRFKSALEGDQPLLVGCTQEAPLFLEIADDAEFSGDLRFVNIREKAGWSAQGGDAGAKMGALIAEAMMTIGGPRTVTMTSTGVVLISRPRRGRIGGRPTTRVAHGRDTAAGRQG